MSHEITRKYHAQIDEALKKLFDKNPEEAKKVSCKRGCFACCCEALYVTRDEALLLYEEHILKRPPEEQELIKAAVKRNVEKMRLNGETKKKKAVASEYLKLWLVCPLLKDGECSVYKDRPHGCRVHFTNGDPAICADPERRMEQLYIDPTMILAESMISMLNLASSNKEAIVMDHLVIFLYEFMFNEDAATVARAEFV